MLKNCSVWYTSDTWKLNYTCLVIANFDSLVFFFSEKEEEWKEKRKEGKEKEEGEGFNI